MVPNNDIAVNVPTDNKGNAVDRAMGLPVVCDSIYLGSATKYADIFDLSDYPQRAFTGLHVRNPDAGLSIHIAIGDNFETDKCLSIPPSSNFILDEQLFGDTSGHVKFRAKLSGTSGTLASGTYNYDNTGAPTNPADGDTVTINGTVFEFSSDMSAVVGRVKVDIKATADLTWTELVSVVNANEQSVTLSIDTATNIVTVTSNYGGTTGNAITIVASAGLTGAGVVVSAATLAGGANGVLPTFHIW
jgi:hypothetical protein